MQVHPITLSVLTWKSPKTLRRTLESLAPIKGVFEERLVICQESDPEEIAISEELGFTPVKLENNVGIQNGLIECVKRGRNKHVMMMENDIPWVVPDDRAEWFASDCGSFLESGLKLCRMDKFDEIPRKRFARFWGDHLPMKRTLSGMLRPVQADSIRAEVVGLKNFAYEPAMSGFLTKVTDTFHITDSSAIFWNNHSLIVEKEFFLNTLVPGVEALPPRRSYNNSPELESTLNCPKNRHWWRSQKFKIGISSPGYFGHLRYDRYDADEKGIDGGGLAADA